MMACEGEENGDWSLIPFGFVIKNKVGHRKKRSVRSLRKLECENFSKV